MPISQFSQPAQGYYQPTYVAPPVQQIAGIGEAIAKQQEANRAQVKQFVANLGTVPTESASSEEVQSGTTGRALGIGGGDVAWANKMTEDAKAAINKLYEDEGYRFTPSFRRKFENIKEHILSNPAWSVARKNKEQRDKTLAALDENGSNLPPFYRSMVQQQLNDYEQYGSIDPTTGKPRQIQFYSVPKSMASPYDALVQRFKDVGDMPYSMGEFPGSGKSRERLASITGFYLKDGKITFEGIPQWFKELPAYNTLRTHAAYLAENEVKANNSDPNKERMELTPELIQQKERALYADESRRAIEATRSFDIDQAAITNAATNRKNQLEEVLNTFPISMFISKFDKSPVATFKPRTIEDMLNVDPETHKLDIGQHGDPLIVGLSQLDPKQFQEISSAVSVYNKFRTLDKSLNKLVYNGDLQSLDIDKFLEKPMDMDQIKSSISEPALFVPSEYTMESILSPTKNSSSLVALDKINSTVTGELRGTFADQVKAAAENGNKSEAKRLVMSKIGELGKAIDEKLAKTPEDIKSQAATFDAISLIGAALKHVKGTYTFNARQVNNKYTTSEGLQFAAGTITMTPLQLKVAIYEARTRAKVVWGEKSAKYKKVNRVLVDADAKYEQLNDKNDAESVLNVYIPLPTDVTSLTRGYVTEYSDMIQGKPDAVGTTKIMSTIANYQIQDGMLSKKDEELLKSYNIINPQENTGQ